MQATKKLPSANVSTKTGQKGCAGYCLEAARNFDLNVSTITKGRFQMKLVCSVNAMKSLGNKEG